MTQREVQDIRASMTHELDGAPSIAWSCAARLLVVAILMLVA